MNTSKELMSQIFGKLENERVLQSNAMPNFIVPPHGQHGDLVVSMDPNVTCAPGKATNHDPKHVPVALTLPHSDLSPDGDTHVHPTDGDGTIIPRIATEYAGPMSMVPNVYVPEQTRSARVTTSQQPSLLIHHDQCTWRGDKSRS